MAWNTKRYSVFEVYRLTEVGVPTERLRYDSEELQKLDEEVDAEISIVQMTSQIVAWLLAITLAVVWYIPPPGAPC